MLGEILQEFPVMISILTKQRTAPPLLEAPTHLRCIADLEEPSPSIEDYCESACCRRSLGIRLDIPMGASAILDQVVRINPAYCYVPGSSIK